MSKPTDPPVHYQSSGYAHALLNVLRILSRASSEQPATGQILNELCASLGWKAAAFWERTRSRKVLRLLDFQPADDAALQPFVTASREMVFDRGAGLPGRVWQSGTALIVPDLNQERNYPRLRAASDAGLVGAAAFPVVTGGDFVGVIEGYSTRPMQDDPELAALITDAGTQFGQFLRRVRAEEELRLREEQYRTLVETAGDAIITMVDDGTIQSFNRAAEEMYGWSAADVVGKPMDMLMPERFRPAHRVGVARYLATGRRNIPWRGIELPGLHRDGSEFPLEISFGEYTHGDARVFTGVLRNVAERTRQQEALAQASAELEATVEELRIRTEQAEAASRSKSEFLAAMSHELRTPLQAVIGFTALLQEQVAGDMNEAQQAQLVRIQSSAGHLLDLIDQLLDIARAEAGTLRINTGPADVCAEVAASIGIVEPLAAARGLRVELDACPAPELAEARLDPARLRQILLNLLSNAVKFTDSGHVRVTVELADAGRFRAHVADTGTGMSATQLAHVFQPFYQGETHPGQRTGMGLGLSISRRLAEAMNGTLTATSELGRGSTFTLDLPIKL